MKPAGETKSITLKGSTQIVTSFFAHAVNRCAILQGAFITHRSEGQVCRSILYQRGIYPPESFKQQKAFGITVMVSTDPGLSKYLTTVLQQMSGAALASKQSSEEICTQVTGAACRLAGDGRPAPHGLGGVQRSEQSHL